MTTTRELQRGDVIELWFDHGPDRPRNPYIYMVAKIGPKTVVLRGVNGTENPWWHDNAVTRQASIRIIHRGEATR